ncbi:hypothetical protein J4E83_007347 [Alternaria metachromatica]|uniref:uncharacterized protein n=1 Tax=Alternaria metachromatica TaxID=283354 RepID=UPI0020C34378|nr:uncharacterized protein J4E83_007347 [Alternaria metachromatica]KAI4613745.1 hypothetical protein J4E83_007347 [Alternaria metachromatica]
MSLPIQPIPFREEIKTLIERIAALQKELKEKTDRLHFLYGFELRSSAAPVGNNNGDEGAEDDKDDEESEDEQEVEAKKTGIKKTAAKTKVNKSAIKTSVKKDGSKKEPRLCKKCEENYLEDNARSNWVNCKECRHKNTEDWNEGRINRERKQKEQNAKRKKQQGDEVDGDEVEVEGDEVGDEREEAEEGGEEDLEDDSEEEEQEAKKNQGKQL